MKITHVVYGILIFGITLSLVVPYLLSNKSTHTYESASKSELKGTTEKVVKAEKVAK